MQEAQVNEFINLLLEAHIADEMFLNSHPEIDASELDDIWKAYERLGLKYASVLGFSEKEYYEMEDEAFDEMMERKDFIKELMEG